MEVSVVSWNVNSIKVRLPRVLDYLKSAAPDILCLQELKCETDKVPVEAFKDAGYQTFAHGQKTYNGVAILSKEEIEEVSTGFGVSELDEQARLVHGRTFGLDIISGYIPNGQEVGSDKFVYKLKWLKQLRTYVEENLEEGEQFAICGDFNVATDDRDLYEPEAFEGHLLYSLPERQALEKFTATGLVDTFRQFETSAGHYSWWDYRNLGFQMGKGLRIDYVYASEALSEFTVRAWIDRDERKGEKPSDHAPVGAAFELD
jgi:exodeoxyribonuclease-3